MGSLIDPASVVGRN